MDVHGGNSQPAAAATAAAPRVLGIRLLGGLELRLGDTPLPPLESARAESLLAYLLLHREAPQPRQHIAFLLWPDSSEPQARTNLRHVLHTLRRALPDADRYLEVTPRTLRWRADAPFRLDVEAVEEALAAGDGVAALREAVEAYTGDLLEGSYDEWLFEPREALRQRYVDALERLVAALEDEGTPEQAVAYAERLLRHDPLREETYRSLMRLHDARGDRARALRVYHACVTTLERELGVEPSAATRELYETLLPADRARAGVDAGPRDAGRVLVGRTSERARLTQLWRRADEGQAQLVLVTGEPGIGKSRLVEELRSWCRHRGAATAEARAYAAEGAIAYGIAAEWLRSEPVAARLPRLEHAHLTELTRLLPDLAARVPGLVAPEPLPESEQRQRLFGALTRAILAAGPPLLLVVDDLQWSDRQTLQFVHYLLRTEPGARLLVAATLRRGEIDSGHPAGELVAGLQALDRLSELELGRLSREETGTLAARITGRSLSDADTERLYADSEGNPLFVVEALRAPVPPGGAPGKVQAVIASRLAQLSEAAGELVGVAATIGREFTAEALAAASELDEPAFVRGLDELWRRGLVRAHGPSAYDFTHGKIREAAHAALGPARRRGHHLRVARALEDGDEDSASGRIAAHYDAAGATAEAVAWYERAADAAQRLHASADAVRSLGRALELVPALPAGRDRDLLELRLLTALPAPLVAVEGYLSRRVADAQERALDLARTLAVEPEPPLIRSLALGKLSRGEFDAAGPLGEQLRARAERDGDDVLWVESAYVLGIASYWQGRLETARGHFEAAVDRYRPEQRSTHLLRYGQDPRVFCQMRLAHTLWLLGRGEEAERARDEALELAERLGHPYSYAGALVFSTILALDQGDEERFRRYAGELADDDVLAESTAIRAGVDAFTGYLAVVDGHPHDGLERVRSGYAEARDGRAAAPGHVGFLARLLIQAYAAAREHAAGLAAADEALEVGGGTELWEAEIRRLRAGFLAGLGAEPQAVAAELARAVEVAGRQGARPFELRAREDLDRLHAGTP